MTNSENIQKTKFYINGQWVEPAGSKTLEVVDPSTETVCATISLASESDVDNAVAAAKYALAEWSSAPVESRLGFLEKLRDIYDARKDEMVEAISIEMGAPKTLSEQAQWAAGAGHIRETIKATRSFEFERDRGRDRLYYEAIGVAALITPWNWPMNQVMLKIAPALAVGCTVVLKPSEIAPLSSMLLTEFVHEAGFPAGVFNMINGDGVGPGSALSTHTDVDMVSFTGSTRAGALITKAAADTVKRVTLELGGKGANVIFADADKDAVERGVHHCFQNTGQSCDAPTRMLIERGAYDEAVKTAVRVAGATQVGPASQDGDHIGPVVSDIQWHKVQGLISDGIAEGAKLVAGGMGKPDGMNAGYFVKPTVFADVTNDMKIAQEEIFGPVLVMIPFDDEAEALRLANDTPYGLGNYVQTQDKGKAQRMAKGMQSGMVEVNGLSLGGNTPFGGYKQSGNGRERSVWGLEEYLEVKAVAGL